ncbi:FecR domain-containing protein [Mucilaginibacter mali]|uniref:FecR domain-containing protein n=1 Tax=Mucilaginibacter mali TaxID=2740462 RepID=A0A7D4TV41_9SPHI|nr:FecR family protein [Mucilaginibacter mali]QKJ30255.1 FecR domain-containing protein [Mucilaginibacter mali]
MNNGDKNVSYLFNLYYTKQATPQQLRELFDLLKTYDDEQLTGLLREAWDDLSAREEIFDEEKSRSMLNNILNAAPRTGIVAIKPKRYWMWGIAASILITAGIGAYFLNRPKPADMQLAIVHPAHDALPGSNKAILTLGSGATVVLDDANKGVVARQGNALVVKSKEGQVDYKVGEDADNKTIEYNTITTPKGYQYNVVLPDGSKVWLNAASSIKFPTEFTGSQRNVEMTGEAYFEVAKNAAMPFIVKTNRQEVRVLGTHFNIMAYDDEPVTKTTLLEGSIMLTGKSSNILKPGNQAIMNAQGDVKIVAESDMDEAVAWKNGFFQFKDESIEGTMRQAARWYDVNINYKGKIPTHQFIGKVPRSVKLSELLSMFKYAGMNFTIDGREVTVMN